MGVGWHFCRLVPRGSAAGIGTVDRSADYRGANAAATSVMVPRWVVSEALQIRSASSDLTRSAARSGCGGGCALLSASWLRLARDSTGCRRRPGGWPHARRFDDHPTAGEKPALRGRVVRSSGRVRRWRWCRWRRSRSASSEFWSCTSMWWNGGRGSMGQKPRAGTGTASPPRTLGGSRQRSWRRSCRLR